MALLAHYLLNGNTLDAVGNNHGYLDNVTWGDGVVGRAADITPASENGVWIPHNSILSDKLFSSRTVLSFHFRILIRSFLSYGIVIGKQSGSNYSSSTSSVWINASGLKFVLGIGEDGNESGSYTIAYATPPLNKWCDVACVSDGDEMAIYIDGVEKDRVVVNIIRERKGNLADIQIGTPRLFGGTNEGFDGMIQDVRLYDHPLSLKEIKDLHLKLVVQEYIDTLDNSVLTPPSSMSVKDTPHILGDMTIVFWVYPTTTSVRQTIWNKGYGGEGTVNLERDPRISFYNGPNGGDTGGYVGYSTGDLVLNTWYHIAVVRDMGSSTLSFYVDGELDSTHPLNVGSIGKTNWDLSIATGYTGDFLGKLRDVRQYASSLTHAQIQHVYRNTMSMDANGGLHAQFEEIGNDTNLLDYSNWDEDVMGSVTGFYVNGSYDENYRVIDVSPFGDDVRVWEARPDGLNGPDGGWNTTLIPIDNTKLYRFSVWVRNTVAGDGRFYLGVRGSGSVQGVEGISDGVVRTNPYLMYDFLSDVTLGEWVLAVGHVWPHMTTTTEHHVDSGVYNKHGKLNNLNIYSNLRDYKWLSGTDKTLHRSYLFYSTNTAERWQWCYPRIDVCDGTEPSVAELLSGFDGRVSKYHSFDIMTMTKEKVIFKQINEVIATRGLIARYPFDGDILDYVASSSVSGGWSGKYETLDQKTGVSVSGIFDDNLVVSVDKPVLSGEEWAIGCWVNFKRFEVISYPIFLSTGLPYLAVDQSGGNLRCSYREGTQKNLISSTSLTLNKWHHVVAYYRIGDGISLFLDGELVAHTQAESTCDFDKIYVGHHSNGSYRADATISDLTVHNKSLNQKLVKQMYSEGGLGFLSDPTNAFKQVKEVAR